MSKKVNVDDDTRYNIHENECYATTMCTSVVNGEGKKEAFLKKKFFCILMIAIHTLVNNDDSQEVIIDDCTTHE